MRVCCCEVVERGSGVQEHWWRKKNLSLLRHFTVKFSAFSRLKPAEFVDGLLIPPFDSHLNLERLIRRYVLPEYVYRRLKTGEFQVEIVAN